MMMDEASEVFEEVCENSQPNQANKGVKRKSDFQIVYCGVCKVTLNSSSQATAHYSGKSHQNKTRSHSSEDADKSTKTVTSPAPKPEPEFFKCEICQKLFNSGSQMKAHFGGKTHQLLAKSKLESSGAITTNTTLALPQPTTVQLVQNNETSSVPEETGPPSSFGSNLSKIFHCAMCNISLNSLKQMEQHNKGLRHKIVIGKAKPPPATGQGEKWENVRYSKIANAILGINKDTVTGSGGGMNLRQFYCEKCDLTVNSQVQLDQHLLSQKHKMKGLQPSNVQNKKKRGAGKAGGTGRGAWQGYQRSTKQLHFGKRSKEADPFVPSLSMNFVPSNTPYLADGYYAASSQYHIIEPYEPNKFSQNWNSNYIYDMPSSNLAMF